MFELTITPSTAEEKQRLLHWLDEQNITDFVEGYIDGVDTPLAPHPDASDHAASDSSISAATPNFDLAPLLIYRDHEADLVFLSNDLSQFFPQLHLRTCAIDNTSWSSAWATENFEPWASKLFAIIPANMSHIVQPQGKIPLFINAPNDAFGTAQHRSTRVMIQALEDLHERHQKFDTILDVGTGTGVLAIACSKLGVKSLFATEISDDLVDLSISNANQNQVNLTCLCSDRPTFSHTFDLVIANILAPALHSLMPDFVRSMSPTATLLLSGFVEKEAPQLIASAKQVGLQHIRSYQDGGWICLYFKSHASTTATP
jgi:ribosomal protein L11 methyltransferase